MDVEILKPENAEARAELIRACQHVVDLVEKSAELGFDGVHLTVDDLLGAAEDAKDQLVNHLIGPIDQPPKPFDPNPRMPVMPERPPGPEDA